MDRAESKFIAELEAEQRSIADSLCEQPAADFLAYRIAVARYKEIGDVIVRARKRFSGADDLEEDKP